MGSWARPGWLLFLERGSRIEEGLSGGLPEKGMRRIMKTNERGNRAKGSQ